ncbi:MAG: tetratricopeptide repeat protein [Candidatus Promineifilaceae bacterium]
MSTLSHLLKQLNKTGLSVPHIERGINDLLMSCGIESVSVAKTSVDNWFKGRSGKVGRGRSEGEPLCLALARVLACSDQETNQLLSHCGYRNLSQMRKSGLYPALVQSGDTVPQMPSKPVADQPRLRDTSIRPISIPPNSYLETPANPHFIGREPLLKQLNHLLEISQRVVLYGPGGIGKTQIALEFAYRYSDLFPDGIFLISFATPAAVNVEIARCGGVRGMELRPNFARFELADQVALVQRAWREPARRLLLFDNVDQVPEGEHESLPRWVHRFAPTAGGARLIMTSRNTDWPAGVNLVPVQVEGFKPASSARLLRRLYGAISAEVATQLSAELGHHPLALHVTGSYLKFVARLEDRTQDLLAQLQQDTLFGGRLVEQLDKTFTPPHYDSALGRVFAESLAQLDDQNGIDAHALELLPYLAVLAYGGAIPIPFLTIVTEFFRIDEFSLLRVLSRLKAIGLIVETTAASTLPRFNYVKMHRLVCQYLTKVLGIPADLHVIFSCARMMVYVETREALLQSQNQFTELARFFMENHGPISAEWLLQVGEFLTNQHLLDLGQACLLASRQQAERDPLVLGKMQLVLLYYSLGRNFNAADELEQSKLYYEKCYTLLSRLVDATDQSLGEITNSLAFLSMRLCDLEAAERYLAESVRIKAHYPNDHHPLAIAQSNQALLIHLQGDYEQALKMQKTSVEMKRELWEPDPVSIGLSYARLAASQQELHQTEAAADTIALTVEAWEIGYGVRNPIIARRLKRLATTYQNNGHPISAKLMLEAAIRLFHDSSGGDSAETLACQAELASVLSQQL